jgi:hypothetical protein
MVEEADYEDNPYLYASKGPKRKVDYSRPEEEEYDATIYDDS